MADCPDSTVPAFLPPRRTLPRDAPPPAPYTLSAYVHIADSRPAPRPRDRPHFSSFDAAVNHPDPHPDKANLSGTAGTGAARMGARVASGQSWRGPPPPIVQGEMEPNRIRLGTSWLLRR